jgi:hypothetical protein
MHRAPRSTAKPRRAVEERSLGDVARGDEVIVKVGGDAEVRQTARVVGGRSAGIGRRTNPLRGRVRTEAYHGTRATLMTGDGLTMSTVEIAELTVRLSDGPGERVARERSE